MDIYIKPVKKASLTGRRSVFVGDVADVVSSLGAAEKVKKILVTRINTAERKTNRLISCTDIIRAVKTAYPEATVNNVGEMDTVLQYAAEKKRPNKLFTWVKALAVVLVLLTGSATAIMSFHTDAQIPKVFENYYSIFYGQHKSNPLIINIPYSIGLAVGIIVFYNHFMGKKLTNDPTPIEVEMSQYDTEVTDTLLDNLQQENQQQEKNDAD